MSINVMKKALDALEHEAKVQNDDAYKYEREALRAAIEQIHTSVSSNTHQPELNTHQCKQEPVAMRYDWDGYGYQYIDSGSGSNWKTRVKGAEPLYAAPQEFICSTGLCHYRKPLTDEEIDRVTDAQWASNNHKPIYAAHRAYARAIEAKIWDNK